MKSLILILLFSSGIIVSCFSQQKLTTSLQQIQQESGLPGFTVAIVDENEILFQEAFGYENIDTKEEFTTQSIIPIASISKTFSGIALMQLLENALLDLDTPINEILPFEVLNPRFPETAITIRHLATHTSSIDDQNMELKSFILKEEHHLSKGMLSRGNLKVIKAWSNNQKKDISEIVFQFLNKEGDYYKKKHFLKSAPGAKYQYSNLGTTLLALIMEIQTGISFDQYVQENIISRLNLSNTSWLRMLSGFEKLAPLYFENLQRVPQYEGLLYPAGGLYSNCQDLSIYLQEMIKGYNGKSEILDKELFREMMTPKLELSQSPPSGGRNYGFFWALNGNKIGHNGGNYGVVLLMDFDKETKIGRIFMTNISSYETSKLMPKMIEIWKLLESESINYKN